MPENARSLLFVPGSRPDRFDKAAASGADAVILDLEDAVRPQDKQQALRHVIEWLADGHHAVVRVNGRGTPWHDDEIAALAEFRCPVMVPKSEDAQAMAGLAAHLDTALIALVETARGVRDVDAIAAAPGVARLAIGTIDLALDLGIDPNSWPALDYCRGRIVVASAAAGLPAPIDGVTTAFGDESLVVADARAAHALGYTGKLCIHPRQIHPIHAAFRPEEREIQWAERVVATVASAVEGAAGVDGTMIDPPVVARARALLARATAPAKASDEQ